MIPDKLSNKYNWIFLLTIPVYFILDACNQFWGLIPILSVFKITGFIILISGILFILLKKIIGSERSVLILSWFMLHYLFFRVIYQQASLVASPYVDLRYRIYFILIFFLTLLMIFFVLKTNIKNVIKCGAYLNMLFLVFTIVEIGKSVVKSYQPQPSQVKVEELTFNPVLKKSKPDIFLIVMDEYSGFRALNEYYLFENRLFTKQLQNRNFFVAKNPNSNYDGTFISTLSLLGMGYLVNLKNDDSGGGNTFAKTAKQIEKNQLTAFLKLNGYSILNNTFFRIGNAKSKPVFFLPFEERIAMSKTFGSFLLSDLLIRVPSNKFQFLANTFYAKIFSYNNDIITQTYQSIEDTTESLFVYSHLFMPHSPYLREKDGRVRSFSKAVNELKTRKYGDSYVNYLEYCNGVVIGMVDSILKQKKNVIIILLSDHGNRVVAGKKKKELDFNNFLSVYASDGNYSGLSDTTCTVNLFRILLNSHFNQNLPLLENRKISGF